MKHARMIEGVHIPAEHQLRIATLNLLHSNLHLDKRSSMLHNELEGLQPDILHIQEANFDGHKDVLNSIMQLGFTHQAYSESVFVTEGQTSATLTLARYPFDSKVLPRIPDDSFHRPHVETLMSTMVINGREVVTFNMHLAWGAREHIRMQQVVQIETEAAHVTARNPDAIILLAGDANAEDTYESMRFLRGETDINGISTLWVDAWKMHGNERNMLTSQSNGVLAHETARTVGITFPNMVPMRRIDYIYVRGWAYGRIGSPLGFGRWVDKYDNGLTVSDHFGLWSDVLLAPVDIASS